MRTKTLSLLLLSTVVVSRSKASSTCRPSNSDCWPTVEEWNQLNETVNGRMISVAPAAQPCYPGPHYSTEQCDAFRESTSDMLRRADYVGAMQYTIWERCGLKNSCILTQPSPTFDHSNVTGSCHQGALPRYALNSNSLADIATVIKFAQERHIALNIKNTGHDLAGKSTSPDSITIWTHSMQKIEYHDQFQPEGCTADDQELHNAMTLGAGVDWGDAYAAAEKYRVTLVGGGQAGVGTTGGWLLGGGHSMLSPTFGLGVDQVLEFRVILANGDYITANKCQHPDLFWALRGGGVGSLGVVTEATVRAHPYLEHIQSILLNVAFTSFEAQGKYHTEMARLSSSFAEARVGGYAISAGDKTSILALNIPLLETKDEAIEIMQPVIDLLNDQKTSGDVQNASWTFETYHGFYEYFTKGLTTITYPVGLNSLLSSRLIPRDTLDNPDSRQELIEAMHEGLEMIVEGLDDAKAHQALVSFFFVTPVSVPDKNSQQTSVTPAWRSSLWHALFNRVWLDGEEKGDDEFASIIAKKVTKAAEGFRKLTPDSGAYINEADALEPSWQDSFWGKDNYQRLTNVKERYDPNNIFHCWRCVGWDENLQREKYRCYKENIQHD